MATSAAAALKALDAQWKKAAAEAKAQGGLKTVDDGVYIARLDGGEVITGAGGNRLRMQFVILEGDKAGETVVKNDGLDGEMSLVFVARMFGRFGYDPEEIMPSKFAAILKELGKAKPVCKVQLKTKEDFQNVYVNAVLEDYEGEEGEEGEEGGEEDGEAVELVPGTRVTFTFGGKADAGEITVVVDEETVKVKKDSSGKVSVFKVADLELEDSGEEEAAEEEEEAEEAEDESEEGLEELQVGMRVEFTFKGVEQQGEVIEIVDEEHARVKKDAGGVVKMKIENLVSVDAEEADGEEEEAEEEEEEEEATAPKKTAAKTPAKPAAKPAAKAPAKRK